MSPAAPQPEPATPALSHLDDVRDAVEPYPDRPRPQRVLVAEGARVVVFAFDAGQELREHSAAFPVLLQALTGHLQVTADGRTVDLEPGGVVHMTTRLPHAVRAVVPSRLMLTMLDPAAR